MHQFMQHLLARFLVMFVPLMTVMMLITWVDSDGYFTSTGLMLILLWFGWHMFTLWVDHR